MSFLQRLFNGLSDTIAGGFPTPTPTPSPDERFSEGSSPSSGDSPTPPGPLGSALDALGRSAQDAPPLARPVPSRASTAASFVSAVSSPYPSSRTGTASAEDLSGFVTPIQGDTPPPAPVQETQSPAVLRPATRSLDALRDRLDATEMAPARDDEALDELILGEPLQARAARVPSPGDVDGPNDGAEADDLAASPIELPDNEAGIAPVALANVVREPDISDLSVRNVLGTIGNALGTLALSVPGVRSAFSFFTGAPAEPVQMQAAAQREETAISPVAEEEELTGATAPYLDTTDDPDFIDLENVTHASPLPALSPIEVVVHTDDATPPAAAQAVATSQERDDSPIPDPVLDFLNTRVLGRGDPTLNPIEESEESTHNDTLAQETAPARPTEAPNRARASILDASDAPGSPDGDDSSDEDGTPMPSPRRDATPHADLPVHDGAPAAQPHGDLPASAAEPVLDLAALQIVSYADPSLAGRARVEHGGRDGARDAQADSDMVRPNDGAVALEDLSRTYIARAAAGARDFVSGYFPTWLGGRQVPAAPVGAELEPQAPTYFGVAADAVRVTGQALTLVNHVLTHPDEVAAAVATVRTAMGIPAQVPRPALADGAPVPAAQAPAQQEPSALDMAASVLPLVQTAVQAVSNFLDHPHEVATTLGTSIREGTTAFRAAVSGTPEPLADAPADAAVAEAEAGLGISLTNIMRDPAAAGRQLGATARNLGLGVVDGVLGRDPAAPVADAEVHADAAPVITLTGAMQDPAGTGRQIGAAVRDLGLGIVNGALGRDPVDPAVVPAAAPVAEADAAPAITFTGALQDPAGTGRQIGDAVRDLGLGIVNGALGRDPVDPAAPANAASLSMISEFLNQMSGWIKEGVKKQTMNMLLGGLSLVLAQAAFDITDPTLAAQLNEMIAEIDRVKAGNGNFETLKTNLTRIMNGQDASGAQVRNILQLHFNGWFQLPLRVEDADAVSSKTILAENIRAIPEEATLPSVDYQRGIPVMQDRIVKNISAMAAMQVANQVMCNGLLSETKLSEILGSCARDDNYLVNVRNKFFAEINNLNLSWHKKLAAKISFAFISLTSNHYLRKFLKSLLEKIETAAKPSSSVEIQAQHTAIVQRTNDYLAILKGTIKRVHEDPSPTANHVAMIEKELAQPKFNHGYTKENLYSKVTSKAIYKILPPLGWTEGFNEATAKMPSALQWALIPFTLPVRLVIFVSESLGNLMVRGIIHTVISRSNILETVIDKSIGQVYRNGYTYSINKVILDQLKHMWKALEKDTSGMVDPKATVANKEELRQLVVNLYDVLELNRRARHADSDPTFLEKAKSAVYKMTTDYSAGVIALIIDKAKNIFLQPDLLPMRQYTLLEALNAAIESTEMATEDEMIKMEQNIMELSDAILFRATKTVVHESFSSAPTEMQKLFKKFTDQLKLEANQFIAKVRVHIGTTNTNTMLGEIKKYNEDVLNLQKLVEADPYVTSEASLFDKHFTKPIAEMLARLGRSISENQPSDVQTGILQEIEAFLAHMPEVKHVNSAVLPINHLAESAASKIAFCAGKEFFDEAWRALRTPYNWRYGAFHHGVMLPFIEFKSS